MIWLFDLLAATLRNATPLVYGTTGETVTERSGVLNLGIEGTMYAGRSPGSRSRGTRESRSSVSLAAIVVGLLAGAAMGVLTVTLGANQHVSGLGLTIALVGLSEFANRLMLSGSQAPAHRADGALGPAGGPGRGRVPSRSSTA